MNRYLKRNRPAKPELSPIKVGDKVKLFIAGAEFFDLRIEQVTPEAFYTRFGWFSIKTGKFLSLEPRV